MSVTNRIRGFIVEVDDSVVVAPAKCAVSCSGSGAVAACKVALYAMAKRQWFETENREVDFMS